MKDEIKRVVELQEELGFDVLVHGEPERNDMVQYFAENLEGFDVTVARLGPVLRLALHPPVDPVGRRHPRAPITVDWAAYAQSLTSKPMKGMLTGPVTILAWSFVRDDQPLGETANQVGLALRDEIADLEAAGIKVIQVDEPALRELLPLRKADQAAYLDWSVKLVPPGHRRRRRRHADPHPPVLLRVRRHHRRDRRPRRRRHLHRGGPLPHGGRRTTSSRTASAAASARASTTSTRRASRASRKSPSCSAPPSSTSRPASSGSTRTAA